MTISPEELALKLKYIVDINHIGLYAKIHDRLYSENVEILRTALQAERNKALEDASGICSVMKIEILRSEEYYQGVRDGINSKNYAIRSLKAQANASASPPQTPPSPPYPAGEGAEPPTSREE